MYDPFEYVSEEEVNRSEDSYDYFIDVDGVEEQVSKERYIMEEGRAGFTLSSVMGMSQRLVLVVREMVVLSRVGLG